MIQCGCLLGSMVRRKRRGRSKMKITIITGSRADWGLLEWPIKTLQEDSYFQGQILKIWGATFDQAFRSCTDSFTAERPDLVLILGDRYEILAAATDRKSVV